jgi:DeoR family fructose operon transcriptional repressor
VPRSPPDPLTHSSAFDASSTVMRLTSALTAARDLIVRTNGPDTFAALQAPTGVTALLTGGRLDERTGSLVGPLACRAASQIAVQTLFVSAAATSPHSGALEATLEEAEVKRSLAAGADNVVLAVDSSKLGAWASRSVSNGSVSTRWSPSSTPDDDRLAPYRRLARIL